MGIFRPGLDIEGGEAPEKRKRRSKDPKGPSIQKEKGTCDTVDASPPAPDKDMERLRSLVARAEKRFNRARNRVSDIESELLLSDDPEDIEDMRAELGEAKARFSAASVELKEARRELREAEARQIEEVRAREEARVETMDFAPPPSKAKVGRKGKGARPGMAMGDTLPKVEDIMPPEGPDKGQAVEDGSGPEPPSESEDDDVMYCEVLEEADQKRMGKGFKWTPKKAIVVGVVLFLVLPVLLYGLVIPRADFTVKTWYFEGFQNSIVVDTKIINDGTVEIRNMDLTISVLKEIDGVEVHLTELRFDDPVIYPMSEQKVDSLTIHDDQNANYILLVEVDCNAGGSYFQRSYTHHIDKPYMTFFFEDTVFKWAL